MVGAQHNLHGVNISDLLTTLLDNLSHGCRQKLVSFSSDGENTMTGRIGGVITLLENQATNKILRVWCIPHQMDLVKRPSIKKWTAASTSVGACLLDPPMAVRQSLITDMKCKYPKDTRQWAHLGNMTGWILAKRRRLLVHLELKRSRREPDTS